GGGGVGGQGGGGGGGREQGGAGGGRRGPRRTFPQGVRGQDAVGAPGHRGAGVHREGPAAGPEGRDRIRGAHDPDLPGRLAVAGAVDLHSHTTASDGTLTPRELVRLAARHGVRVLALTRHAS